MAKVTGAAKGVIGGWFDCPRPLEGLQGDHADQPWLGLTLRERQDRAFLQAGSRIGTDAETVDVPRVLVREDVALTHFAVEEMARIGAEQGEDCSWKVGGRHGRFVDDICFGRSEPLLVWLKPGGAVTPERIAAAQPVEVDPVERLIQVPVPQSQLGVDLIELPLSDRLVVPTSHWLQLLWANLLGLAPFLWRTLAGRNAVEVVIRGFFAAIKAGSRDPMRIGAQLGRQGNECRIHPSAVVEGCWLGDGVEIGAGAVVRASVLGDGVSVEPLAMVECAVLAPGAKVQRLALLKYAVLAERAAAGGAIQLSVLGRDAGVKYTAALMDMAFGQGVQVKAGGQMYPAPLGLAGVCVGDRSIVGAGVMIAPGRAIPPDLNVVRSPDTIVRSIPDGISGTVTARGGRLEEL